MKINVLDPKVYNRISAGEVVERPASIVKELVENSIDAGAKSIRIEIEEGGIKSITVIDDGCGIEKEDLTTAFLPHATSKIKDIEDLDSIESLGFRGEALASIASVCQVTLSSKTKESESGYSIKVNGGQTEEVVEIAKSNGTTIRCANLFYNTPVRAKFLRKPKTEEAEVTHLIEKFMLSNSNISFQYYVDGNLVYNTISCSMPDIIYTIYGKDVYDNLIELDYEEDGFKVKGYVTKPKISKNNRTYQTLFVNGRYVENYLISNAVQGIYESFLMKGRFPVYVISLQLPTDCVDVNVHPSKREVKFDNPNRMFGLVRRAVEKALLSIDQIQQFIMPSMSNEENVEISETSQNKEPSITLEPKDLMNVENKQIQKDGRSFNSGYSVDLFDSNEKLIMPKEVEIDVKPIVEKQTFKELENLSLNKNTAYSNDSSTLYFDMSGEKMIKNIEACEKSFLKSSVRDEMKILGTLFKTYIVVELSDSVYFIDQHAAHERLLYDKLVKLVDDKKIVKQDLLAPFEFTVGTKEAQSIELMFDDLKSIGFDLEKNGNSFTVLSVPYMLSNIELESFVNEIVKEGIGWDKKASDFIHNKLCQSACKHAIKAGDTISNDECAYILEEVRKGVMLCPHGRPITLVITKHEFEKMFKRIV